MLLRWSDWRMPRMNGFELCKAIRAGEGGDRGTHPYTYFVFVTASGDKAHFIEGMHAGADDYLTKPVDLDELEVRLEAARRVITLYRRLSTSNERLRRDSARSFRAARTTASLRSRTGVGSRRIWTSSTRARVDTGTAIAPLSATSTGSRLTTMLLVIRRVTTCFAG